MKDKKPQINQDLCIGCGLCETVYPAVFKLNDELKAEVVGEVEDKEKLQEAVDSCPVQAISR